MLPKALADVVDELELIDVLWQKPGWLQILHLLEAV
jgi:hypothetical protein